MLIDFSAVSGKEAYLTMIQVIVPRPIAWVLSRNEDQGLNLAPFSYFNGVTSKPPLISISIGKKRQGDKKDTWRNIEERSDFVVHIAASSQAPAVSATSASLAYGDSEVTQNDLALTDVDGWSLPRLYECAVAMACERYRIIEIGDGPQGLVLGRIQSVYLADSVASAPADGGGGVPSVDYSALKPLARLGGDDYGELGRVFSVERPA